MRSHTLPPICMFLLHVCVCMSLCLLPVCGIVCIRKWISFYVSLLLSVWNEISLCWFCMHISFFKLFTQYNTWESIKYIWWQQTTKDSNTAYAHFIFFFFQRKRASFNNAWWQLLVCSMHTLRFLCQSIYLFFFTTGFYANILIMKYWMLHKIRGEKAVWSCACSKTTT